MNMSSYNDWDVSYSHISFFERALSNHRMVEGFERTKDILFKIDLTNGKQITALLVNEYSLGLVAVLRAREEFPEADFIVTAAIWNGYTKEAKDWGRQNDVGVFIVSDFFGALFVKNPKLFVQKDDKGRPIYHYK